VPDSAPELVPCSIWGHQDVDGAPDDPVLRNQPCRDAH
jgi:hypothetical protein